MNGSPYLKNGFINPLTPILSMKKGEIQLNKWHFKLGFIPIYWRRNGYMLHCGIFKMRFFPPEGSKITKECYKGFWFRKEFGQFNGFEINF